jgi:hypothetical protein
MTAGCAADAEARKASQPAAAREVSNSQAAERSSSFRRIFPRRTVTGNGPHDADDVGQWILTLFLGPIAAVLAGIVIGLLLRGSGLR